jgi:hypothetical protein
MDRKPHIDLPRFISGDNDVWDNDNAGVLLTTEFFPSSVSAGPTYLGADGEAAIALGTRSPSQLYLGAGSLF